MKIAHLVRQYAPSVGGLEDYVDNLARAQIADGHAVRVVTLNTRFQTGEKLPAKEYTEGIEIRRVRWFGSQRYPLAPGVLAHLRDVDIVHVHALDFFVDYLSMLRRLGIFRTRLVFSTHGGIFHTPHQAALKRLWFNVITRINLRAFDEVICCSDNDLRLFAPIRRSLRLIENGVLLRKFGLIERGGDGHSFIYLGRFSENKNLSALIEWFALFARSCPGAQLHIVGRSETGDVQQLRSRVAQLRAEEAIHILPDLGESELRSVLARCSYVVSASRYEGFGLSVIELMSYGLTPLLSDIPSFRAFVERSGCGELFELNAQSFCRAAHKLMAADRAVRGRAARDYVDGFAWPRVWAKIDEVYRANCV